jgi:transposase InsO family protein
MRFAFIDVEKASYPLRVLCRVLHVSRSGFYAWLRRKPSNRELEDERLRPKIVDAFKIGRGTYGSPRVQGELVDQGIEVGRRRVARLMRDLGLQGLSPRKFRVTTDSNHNEAIAPNVLARNFVARKPNEKWAKDITYILDGRRLALSGRRDESLLASHRRMVDGRASGDESLPRCAIDGDQVPDKRQRNHPPLGSRGSIC